MMRPQDYRCLACGAQLAYDLGAMYDVHVEAGPVRFADPAVDARHRDGANITAEEMLDDRQAARR